MHLTPKTGSFFTLLFLRLHLHLDTQPLQSCARLTYTHTHEYLGGTFSNTNSQYHPLSPDLGTTAIPLLSVQQNLGDKIPQSIACNCPLSRIFTRLRLHLRQ